ncbi:hypothetical protein M404DRAFT_994646, partial [Pisolithus tinctorius Marx 270]
MSLSPLPEGHYIPVCQQRTLTWNDTLELSAQTESSQSFLIRRNDVLSTFTVLQPGMFWSNTRIIQSSTDRVCFYDLTSGVWQDIRSNS